MNSGKTIFAQLMDFIPTYEFRKCLERYDGNFKVKSFSCWDQFLTMAFAQLAYRESLMDRGYLDFSRLYHIHQSGAFFITRAKKRFDYKRLHSMPADKTRGVKSEQAVARKNFYPKQGYPERLRHIHYFDSTTQNRLIFLTNNFRLSALTIADLYRCRWQVELFFRWIKQHLRIKAFYGTSDNAVKLRYGSQFLFMCWSPLSKSVSTWIEACIRFC
jgi:hypothetical protein